METKNIVKKSIVLSVVVVLFSVLLIGSYKYFNYKKQWLSFQECSNEGGMAVPENMQCSDERLVIGKIEDSAMGHICCK